MKLLCIFFGILISVFLFVPPARAAEPPVHVTTIPSRPSQIQFITVPSGYVAFGFKWQHGHGLRISLGNEPLAYPTLMEDAHDDTQTHSYSELYFISGLRTIRVINNTGYDAYLVAVMPTQSPRPLSTAGMGEPGNGLVNFTVGASYTEQNIINRQMWGANESLATWQPEYKKVTKVFIHHTAGSSSGDYVAIVKAIFNYHTIGHEWGDIGYNFLIDPNGVVYEGRKGGDGVVGAHAYRSNAGSIGIAFIGTYSSQMPTSAAITAFRQLLVEKSLIHGFELNWGSTVFGHRDAPGNTTSCPGTHLYEALSSIVTDTEVMRQSSLATSVIYQKRQLMLANLAEYDDVRLKIVYKDTSTTEEQIRQMIPPYSGIMRIVDITANTATIIVSSVNYYDGMMYYDSPDRLQLLYLIFSLDPGIDRVELISDAPIIIDRSVQDQSTTWVTSEDSVYLRFSRPLRAGTGNVGIRRSDGSTFTTIPIDSPQLELVSDHLFLRPALHWELNTTYEVAICGTCLVDARNQVYSDIALEHWTFTNDMNWSEWQLQDGASDKPVGMTEFAGRMYQSVKGASYPGKIWLRSSADMYFNGSDWEEYWGSDGPNGATPEEIALATFKGRLYMAVKGNSGMIFTKSMGSDKRWDDSWQLTTGLSGKAIAMVTHTSTGEERLYQFIRGKSPAIYYRYTTDGIFDGRQTNEGWTIIPGITTTEAVSATVLGNDIYLSWKGTDGDVLVGRAVDGDLSQLQVSSDGQQTASAPAIAAYRGVFVQSIHEPAGGIYVRYSIGGKGWSNWVDYTGRTRAKPMLAYNPQDGSLYDAIIGKSGNIWLRKLSK